MSNEYTMEEDQVSPEEVQEFLRTSKKLDLDEETARQLVGTQKDTEDSHPVETDSREELSSRAPGERFVHDWAMRAPDMGEVTVDETEKAVFLKACLHDLPVIMDILVPSLGKTVTIKTLTSQEFDVLYGALDRDREELKFAHEAQFISDLQEYSLYMQVLKIGSQPYKYTYAVDPEKPLDTLIEEIRQRKTSASKSMNQAQRAVALQALRIFSLKNTICTDNLFNSNFWNPPDVG